MIAGLGFAASALDALQALISSKKANGATSTTQQGAASSTAAMPFGVPNADSSSGSTTGTTAVSQNGALASSTLAALFDAQGLNATSPSSAASRKPDALKSLFAQLDTDGNGQISKAEFEDKLGAGGTNVAAADSVFAKLDANADGSVNQDELGAALKGAHGKAHHHHSAQSPTGAGGDSDPLLQALQGASSATSSNSDGTTTTSMTFADGSQVAMTSAPKNAAASAATSSYNFIEQMIQRQAKALQSSASTGLSISA